MLGVDALQNNLTSNKWELYVKGMLGVAIYATNFELLQRFPSIIATFYSHTGNEIFPRWEQNIPTLGINNEPGKTIVK